MDDAAYQQELERERKRRLALLRAYRRKLARAIKGLQPEIQPASYHELTAAVRMLCEQSRHEHRAKSGDPPDAAPAERDEPPAALPVHPLDGIQLRLVAAPSDPR